MDKIPDFLEGIDPDMVRTLDRQLDEEADRHSEKQMTSLESYRTSYIEALSLKMDAIEMCMMKPSVAGKFRLSTIDEIARSHFLYYMDQLFVAPPIVNREMRLAEALIVADGTQAKLNMVQTGQQYLYDASELHARVAEIMLDEPVKAKQDITDLYDRTIREVVLRYLNS